MNAKIWGRWVSRLFQQRRFARQARMVQRRLWFEALEDRVTPATINWTGNGANNLWTNANNWNLARAPLAGDDLVFGNLASAPNRTTSDNLSGLPIFNSITISASGYIINGSLNTPKLAISGAINVGSNFGTETITLDLQLVPPAASPQQTFTVNTGSNLVLSGHLSGSSDAAQAALQSLTKEGAGVLELSNNNSAYTGAFTIASGGGVLIASQANALGLGAVIPGAPTAGTTTVNSNSQLQLKNVGNPITERLILNGTGVADNGALLNIAGNNTWDGPITLDSDASIGGNANTSLNISGLITDTGASHSLTKEGAGRLILSRVGGNIYRGQTIVDNGILTIRDPLALGAGADSTKPQSGSPQSGTIVNFNSTTGEAGTLQLEFTSLGANDPNGILQNPALPFNALTNPYIGFQVFNDLLTLNGPGFGNIGAISSLTGKNGWDGDVIIGSLPPTTGAVNIGAAAGSELTIGGVISDPNRQPVVMKVLPGRVIFNSANTYRGQTIVVAGALNVRDSSALGSGDVDVRSGASLELDVDSGLDGTALRTHNRNLGFDSARGSGPGQEVSVTGAAGTFTLSFKGQTTAPLAYNATAAQVQAALNALSTINGGVGNSVTVSQVGSIFRVVFNGAPLATTNQPLMTATGANGAAAVVSPIYGLTVGNLIEAAGLGANNTGALRSISGINTYAGLVGLGDLPSPALGSIGVDRDARPGHDTPNANYFAFDHSLTVTGEITNTLITPTPASTLIKVGDGHLILPTANTYTDRTEIRAGWVTAQNDRSLGTMNPVQAPTLRPYTTIADGAALHLKPFAATTPNLVHNYDLNGSLADSLAGPALTPNGGTLNATNYTFGAGQGPSLSGALADPGNYSIETNFHIDDITGFIRLIEFKDRSSDFGLYSVDGVLTFYNRTNAASAVITAGQNYTLLLTRNSATKEVVAYIDGVEQFRFFDNANDAVFSGPGNIINFFNDNIFPSPFPGEESSGVVDRIRIYDGPLTPAPPGLNLINNFIVSGTGVPHNYGLLNHAGAIENIAGNNTLSGIIKLNGTAGFGVEELTPPGPGGDPSQLNLTGHLWDNGAIAGGITKLGSRRLVIQGAGTYTGDVDVKAGVLLVQSDTALGAKSAPGAISGPIQGLTHSYELNGSYADTLGGPSLAPNGGTLNATNYSFGPGQGLNLSGALTTPDNYSIEMVFSLNTLTGANGSPFVNLIEFKNHLADTGLYSLGGALNFFDDVTGPSGAFTPNVPATLLLTRNASTKEVVGYVNGVEQIRFTDSADEAVFSSPGNIINFLIDDAVFPNENAGGAIDRIRIFDRPLTPSQLNPTGNATIVEAGAALEIGNSNTSQTQGLMGGLGIWGEHLVLNGRGNSLFGDAALTVLSSNSPTTNIANDPVFPTDNAWRGPISLGSDTTITVQPNSRILLTGGIDDQLNPLPSGSSLTVSGGGVLELVGANTYRGSTIVNEGVLTIDNSQALGGSGNAEVQTVTLTAPTAGITTFTLTFNNKTTAPILFTGDLPTDRAAVQAALNALTSLGGSANVGGAATVLSTAPGVFDVTLGGSLTGFNQSMMTAAVTVGPGSIDVTEKIAGSGGTEIANGASLHLVGSITVAGEPLIVHGMGNGATPVVPTQWFQVGPEAIANGQTPGNQHTTGRITGTVVDPRDPNIIYISTAGGGAWKTIDGGQTWRPIFDALPEVQTVTVNTTGSFTLTFDGQTTAALNGSSATLAADIQAALNALSSIGNEGAHVTVTRAGNIYSVTFGGALIGADVTPMSASANVQVATAQNGKDPRFAMYIGTIAMPPIDPSLSGGVNNPINQARANTLYLGTGESDATGDSFYGTGIYVSRDAGQTWSALSGTEIQDVTVTGTTGTFDLTFDGETTTPLAFNATITQVQNALDSLSTIGGVGGATTVTLSGIREVQQLTMVATAGPFTLTFNGSTTTALNSASATLLADIQAALTALPSIIAVGGVTVTSPSAGVFRVLFGTPGDQPLIISSAFATITDLTPRDFGTQLVEKITMAATAGLFTLSFNGDTTGNIDSASATLTADIQAALNALPSIVTAGGVVVTSPSAGVFNVTFTTAGPQAAIVSSFFATLVDRTSHLAADQAIQKIRMAATAGPFRLTFNGQTTAVLDSASATLAADIQTALNALPAMIAAGGVTVATSSAGVFDATFNNAGLRAPITSSLFTNITRLIAGGPLAQEVQQIALVDTAGTFTLTFGANTTGPINAASATLTADIQAALTGLASISSIGGVTVTSLSPGNFRVTFNAAGARALITGSNAANIADEIQRLTMIDTAGNFRLTFGANTTGNINAASATLTTDIQNALNGLASIIAIGGVTVNSPSAGVFDVAFNAIGDEPNIVVSKAALITDEVQRITMVDTAGPFTLTFGADTTTPLASATVTAAIVQNALNLLPSIIAAGGVTVTQFSAGVFDVTFNVAGDEPLIICSPAATSLEVVQGTRVYSVQFGGTLANVDVSLMTTTSIGGAISAVTVPAPSNPFDGKAISKIVIDPFTTVMYVASGDVVAPRNEEQDVWVRTGGNFTLSFTNPDATGNIVTLTTTTLSGSSPTLPTDMQNALNALATINGAVTVTSVGGGHYRVVFARNLGNLNVAQLVGNPGYPTIVMSTPIEGGGNDINGTQGGPGIWRLQGGNWSNLTSFVSTFRSTVASTVDPTATGANPFAGNGTKLPNTPGPDDDYRLEFPQINATWTDLALIYTDTTNNPNNGNVRGAPVLYAALGTTAGTEDINNGVYWSKTSTSNNPVWYVGDPGGSPYAAPPGGPLDPTTSDARAGGFPRGTFAVPNPGSGNPPVPEVALNGNIKLAAVPIANTTGTELVTSTVYAAVSTPEGTLRGIFKTVTGAQSWAAVTTPSYLYAVGNFSNAILAMNANTVFIGGQGLNAAGPQTILMTTDGGTTWTDVSFDINGNGPHAGIHSFARDSLGRLLVATDGGLWRRETNGDWTNLNGDLAISQINGVASDPTRTISAVGGAQANGIAKFDNGLLWARQDSYGGGPVAIDPVNSLNIYAVGLLTGTNAVLRKSIDGGLTWNTVLAIGNPTAPLVVDPVNPARVLVGGVRLSESNNGGATWTNLTTPLNVRSVDVHDVAIANAQGAFAVDPGFLLVTDQGSNAYNPDTIYITNGSAVYVTKNHGQTWVDRTGSLFNLGSIADIIVDPRNRDTVYAVRSAFGGGQIFRSTDAGQTWTNITGNLPDVPAWKAVVDPRNGNLYVGTDIGVFHSTDGGVSWQRFGVGMPNVQVKDLELNLTTNTLLAGTYGRSVYQLFLDTPQTSTVPVAGVVAALGGSSVWTGNVVLDGDPGTNGVIFSAYGIQNLPNGTPVASLNFVGPISDLSADRAGARVTKIGLGDVIFSGSNIYGGQTIVQEGALVVDNTHALGGNANGTTVVNGAALELRSNLDAEPITLNGNGFSFNDHFTGSLRNIAGVNTYVGPLTLATNATIGVDSGTQLTIGSSPQLPGTGTIIGTSDLIKELSGTLVLGGSNNLFSGATQVNQGVLRLENSNALGATSGVRVLDGSQVQLNSAAGGPPVTINVPLTLSSTGIFGSGALLNFGGNNAWNGDITIDALPGFSADTFPNGAVAIGSTNAGDTLTIGGRINQTAAVGLTKVGAGRVALTSFANGYSGATEVLQGILDVRDPGALGTRTTTNSVQRVVTLSAEQTGSFRLGFNGALTNPIGWGALAGAVQAQLNALPTINGIGSVVVTRLEIPTTTQNGPGAPGTGYIYTITFNGGLANTIVPVSATGTGGTGAAASVVATGGINVRVASGATLELTSPGAGFTVPGRKLTLNGTGDNGAGALLNVAGNNTWSGLLDLPVDATISANAGTSIAFTGGVAGAGSKLTKIGPGTLGFPAGGNNQAATIITDGTVDVDGVIGAVVLNGGTLAGAGLVGAISPTGNGGAVNPGDPADPTGTLSSTVGGVLDATNTYFVDLVNAAANDNDRLNVTSPTGTIDLGGATLNGTTDLGIVVGDRFTILQTANPNGVINHFAGFSTTPIAGGTSATIAYIGGVKYVVDYFPDHVVLTRELANVAITLTPSIAAPVYGQPETITATFTSEPGAPPATGVVTLTFDGIDTVVPIVNGVATFNATATNPLAVGNHTVGVAYNGHDAANQIVFNPANAGPLSIVVAPAGTSTALAASVASPVYGQSIIFTSTVTSLVITKAPNTLLPQGTVSFFRDSGILMGTVTLDGSGVATFNTSSLAAALPVGSHSFQAVYNSDGVPDNYNGSNSSTLTRFISKANTGTSVATSGSPTVFGEPVTFTATITASAPGSGIPGGIVSFRANGALIGTGTVNASGIATYTTTAGQLLAGVSYTITATYGGDSNFNSSAGATAQTVTKVNSTTTLTSSSSPSAVFGEPVTFTATVAAVAPGGGVATGVVTFKRDGVVIGTGTINASSQASYTTTFGQLPLGAGFVITAEFAGDSNFNASTGSTTQDVITSGTTTAVASSNPSAVFGEPVTFTATVAPIPPGNGFPSGTVTFKLGAVTLGSGTLTNGVATYTTTLGQLAVGAGQVITATYSGNAGFSASSGTVSQTVNQAGTTTTVSASANPSGVEQPVTFTATVAPIAPGTGAPTGTVTFRSNGNIIGTGALSTVGGVTTASFTAVANTFTAGVTYNITADYPGDTNYLASTGGLSQTVLSGTTTALASSANPSKFGQSVIFTATVAPATPGATPTGTVTFTIDGILLGTSALNAGGVATFTTTAFQLAVGANQMVTASYNGNAAYAISSGSVAQTVNESNTTTTLTAAPAKGVAQRAITFTAHVGSGAGTPTGQVVFTDQRTNVVLGTATLDASGNAVLVHHLGGPLGKHSVHANYLGDGDHSVGSGAAVVKIVANGVRASTVALKSSATPSIVGVPVTFTATVRDVGGTPLVNPGGTVMFLDASTIDPATGKPVVLGYGKLVVVRPGVMRATFTTNALAVGSYDVRARYSGNGLFARSISDVVKQEVKPVPTRTSSTGLDQSSALSPFGQSVSFAATVTDTGSVGTITPTGTVTFTDTTTNTVLGTVNLAMLSAGVARATLATTVLNVGTHAIVATYNGDTDFVPTPGAPSSPVTHTVTQAPSVLTLSSNANPSKFGQSVTFKATISSSTSAIPTGTVKFFDGGIQIGTGTINAAGVAAFSTSSLAIGPHSITATYAGDTNFIGSNTGSLTQTVDMSSTTATLQRSISDAAQPLTLTATILAMAPGSGAPTGSVTFMIDGVARGTVGMTNGMAALFVPDGLSQGSHSIVVKYLGDGNYNPSNTTFTMLFGGRTI